MLIGWCWLCVVVGREPVGHRTITCCGTTTTSARTRFRCWPTSCVTLTSDAPAVCPYRLRRTMPTLSRSGHDIISSKRSMTGFQFVVRQKRIGRPCWFASVFVSFTGSVYRPWIRGWPWNGRAFYNTQKVRELFSKKAWKVGDFSLEQCFPTLFYPLPKIALHRWAVTSFLSCL